MKCWKCGAELVPGAAFCNSCGAKQEQAAPNQGQPPYQGQPGAGAGGSNMILTAFAAICMAVCGGLALRAVFYAVRGVFRITLYGFFTMLRVSGLNALAAIMLILMAVFCALIAFKRTEENTDGLLVCLAGSGVGFLIVKLLSTIINGLAYPHGFASYLGKFVLSIFGVAVAVAGVYVIERFVLGEMTLVGKSTEDLKMDVQIALHSFQQSASEVGAQASQAAQNAKAEREARAAAQQAHYAAQQAQFNQTNPQYQQPGPGGAGGPQYQYQQPQTPPPPPGYAPFRLKADRSLVAYILLSLVTCGIYSWYFIYALARDVNAACAGDGKSTAGLLKLILLSMITCGFYGIYWYYALGNRLAANAPRYGLMFQENGTTVLLWQVIGSLLCGIGPFVAWHIIIKNTNALCGAYNYQHGI